MMLDGWKLARVLFQHVLPRLALLYVLAGCGADYMNSKLVFHPQRKLEDSPGRLGMAFEDVRIKAADGPRLHAWYVPAEGEAIGAALFCHGNAGNISHRVDTIRVLHELGLNVLIFDYRGYGRSEGRPTEKGVYLDAEAAWRYLTEQLGQPPERIVLHGRSLGGSVAAHLARDHKPAALVVESTFYDITELGAELYPWLPVRWISRLKFKTADYVAAATCPVMVIHSRNDDLIPIHHGRKVFDAAPEPKRFLEIRGGHNDGFYLSRSTYVPALREFLAEHLKGR